MMMTEFDLTKLDGEAQKLLAKYDTKKAATLMLLHMAQEKVGYVNSNVEAWVSKWTDVPVVHVHEVVMFYSMYHKKPAGKHHIRFCTSTSCILRGAEGLLCHIKNRLNIENGQTTQDGRFSLEEAECLCACEHAPMMQVGDAYYLDLTPEKIDKILEGCRS